ARTRKWIWLGGFLLTTALGTGASESSGPAATFQDQPRKGRPWKIEPAVARDLDKGSENIVEVEIVASVEQIQFAPGKAPTEVWTYNGTIPGPTIEANVGDTLIVHFYNELPEKSTIHWHGLELPAHMDGSNIAQNPVPPGGYFRYEFKLLRPSLYWYHPHVRSNEQIEKGLYGSLIVHDPEADAALGLPVQEHLLVLDDILLDADGSVAAPFPNGPDSLDFDPLKFIIMQANGREGNTLLVNGQADPEPPTVDEGVPLRLRVVNAANARFMRLSIPGHDIYKIGGDGGLLESPVLLPPIPMEPHPLLPGETISQLSILGTESGVMLTPGERADIVFTPRGKEVTIEWHDFLKGRHAVYLTDDPETRYPPLPDYLDEPPPPQLPPYPTPTPAAASVDSVYEARRELVANHIPPPPGVVFALDFDPIDGYAPPETLLTLKVKPAMGEKAQAREDYVPPDTLRSIPPIDLSGAGLITSRFVHSLPDDVTGEMTFAVIMKNGMPVPFPAWTPADAPTVAPGDTVIWDVVNLTGGNHSFHLHGFMFEVLEYEFIDRDTPAYNFKIRPAYREEKDTVQLPFRPGSLQRSSTITRLAVRFDDTGREGQILAAGKVPGPETSGGWLFHCHLLEHARLGMMGFLQIINP
ncbi:MAG: multicopper oxidase family protein, partial [Deltaproteobacteria bacterium]|nr:multicopper oxidase family protein [Deltaproteobacteria bacterium]